MTRFVVACDAVLRLASEEVGVAAEHELLAPTLLRSQALSAMHEAVHRGICRRTAGERLARINAMPIRLLGDAVLRRQAWKSAGRARLGGHVRRGVRRADEAPGGRVRHARPASWRGRSRASSPTATIDALYTA